MSDSESTPGTSASEAAAILSQPRVRGIAPRVIGGAFGLCAFAVAVLAGLAAQNPTSSILGRALLVMLICYPIGYIIGVIIDRTVERHVDAGLNPPSMTDSESDSDVAHLEGDEATEAIASV